MSFEQELKQLLCRHSKELELNVDCAIVARHLLGTIQLLKCAVATRDLATGRNTVRVFRVQQLPLD
jgi:hypothetical protein